MIFNINRRKAVKSVRVTYNVLVFAKHVTCIIWKLHGIKLNKSISMRFPTHHKRM